MEMASLRCIIGLTVLLVAGKNLFMSTCYYESSLTTLPAATVQITDHKSRRRLSRLRHMRLGHFSDPKSINLRLSDSLMLEDNDIPNDMIPVGKGGVLDAPPPSLRLPDIPSSLSWVSVSDTERQSTSTCTLNPDPRLRRCCIGQCRKEFIKIQEGTPEFDALFVKPDMSNLANMQDMLEVLHYFMNQKRAERQRQREESRFQSFLVPPSMDIDTCAMWFIGDSLTSDVANAALCQLTSLGYEISPTTKCEIKHGGLLMGLCDLRHPSEQQHHCPKIRLRMDYYQGGKVPLYKNDFKSTLDEAGPIIINHGVHENSREDFERWMNKFFYRAYNGLTQEVPEASRYKIMWREHEPQHFQSKRGGAYDGALTECGPPSPNEDGSPGTFNNYRNEEAYNFLVREGLVPHAVHIIPQFDAHKPVHAFHYPGDCTHYCYTPWRFDLTWHGVAMGLLQTQTGQQ